MIDWAIEAWNDYGKDLKEYLQNEEVIKEIRNSDESENTQGIGCVHHDDYIKLHYTTVVGEPRIKKT